MTRELTPYSLQDQLERARKALLKVSPEARARILNEYLEKRKTRSRNAKLPAEREPQPDKPDSAMHGHQASLGAHLSNDDKNVGNEMVEMFGTRGKLSSGLTFDEDSYARAKPHFQAMLKDFEAAGKDVRDLIRAMMEVLGDGARPYIKRFAQDLRDESTIEGEGQETQDGIQGSVPDGDAGTGAEAVSGAAQDRADGRAPSGQERGSAPDAGRTDQGRAEAQERPARGTLPDAGKARRPRDAGRVPARVRGDNYAEKGMPFQEKVAIGATIAALFLLLVLVALLKETGVYGFLFYGWISAAILFAIFDRLKWKRASKWVGGVAAICFMFWFLAATA